MHANKPNAMEAWDGLRKSARKLENELDMKLVSFSKLGINEKHKHFKSGANASNKRESSTDRLFETMSMEIERLLTNLTEINDHMSDYLTNLSFGEPSPAQLHAMERHRDILQEYSHEFTKTKSNIKATKDREDLLGSVQRDISDFKSGLSHRADLYLKENEHMRSSDRMADETIDIAMNTKEHLTSQRKMFQSISGRVMTITNIFPAVNNLVKKINIRKRRDALILGLVISVCVIIMLMYSFH